MGILVKKVLHACNAVRMKFIYQEKSAQFLGASDRRLTTSKPTRCLNQFCRILYMLVFTFFFFFCFFLQWRTIFAVLLPYILLHEFHTRVVKAQPIIGAAVAGARFAGDPEHSASSDDDEEEGGAAPVHPTRTVAVDVLTRKRLRTLFVTLACAVRMIFVRINFASTVDRVQHVLQNFCILFTKEFPNDVVPNMHFAMHFKGKLC
jgi:hypothetical protein